MAFKQHGRNRNMEVQKLRSDVWQLSQMLETEKHNRCQEYNERLWLQKELEDTKQKLQKQKSLKEMYIKQGRETKKELELLKKYSKEETLSTFEIAQKVNDTKRQKKKKQLHVDYEELQVAHIVNTNKFTDELQAKDDKIEALQVKLDSVIAEHLQLKTTNAAEKLAAKQQVDSLQEKLDQLADRESKYQQLIQSLRADLDTASQETAAVLGDLQQSEFERVKMQTELDDLQSQVIFKAATEEALEKMQLAYRDLQDKFADKLQEEKHQEEEKQHPSQHVEETMSKLQPKVTTLLDSTMAKESTYAKQMEELRAKIKTANVQLAHVVQEESVYFPPEAGPLSCLPTPTSMRSASCLYGLPSGHSSFPPKKRNSLQEKLDQLADTESELIQSLRTDLDIVSQKIAVVLGDLQESELDDLQSQVIIKAATEEALEKMQLAYRDLQDKFADKLQEEKHQEEESQHPSQHVEETMSKLQPKVTTLLDSAMAKESTYAKQMEELGAHEPTSTDETLGGSADVEEAIQEAIKETQEAPEVAPPEPATEQMSWWKRLKHRYMWFKRKEDPRPASPPPPPEV